MYLVADSGGGAIFRFETKSEARKYAEDLAKTTDSAVQVWVLTDTVQLVPQVVWTEHARGINNATDS